MMFNDELMRLCSIKRVDFSNYSNNFFQFSTLRNEKGRLMMG